MKPLRLIASNNLVLKEIEQTKLEPSCIRISVKSVGIYGSEPLLL